VDINQAGVMVKPEVDGFDRIAVDVRCDGSILPP